MQNYQIRKALKPDAKLLADIYFSVFNEHWDMEKYIAEAQCYICDNVGMLIYEINLDEAEIKTIAVLEGHRKNKIGFKLLEHILQLCQLQLIKKIFLEVSVTNIAALKLYEKFGFKKFNLRKNYYPDGSDAILMCLQFN